MSAENFDHIYYKRCRHFTVGHVDQWGESGFLYYEGKIYAYEEDRKGQWGRTYNPMSVSEFISYAKNRNIEIPKSFEGLIR